MGQARCYRRCDSSCPRCRAGGPLGPPRETLFRGDHWGLDLWKRWPVHTSLRHRPPGPQCQRHRLWSLTLRPAPAKHLVPTGGRIGTQLQPVILHGGCRRGSAARPSTGPSQERKLLNFPCLPHALLHNLEESLNLKAIFSKKQPSPEIALTTSTAITGPA
uniref:Uncharacterized protein n=1 Tax=Molossus molossus TaxID=27622 RepID=A0A7J8E3U5_MOLMO|nr:hypothetical protein HJG59_015532 [Molossus molossus]